MKSSGVIEIADPIDCGNGMVVAPGLSWSARVHPCGGVEIEARVGCHPYAYFRQRLYFGVDSDGKLKMVVRAAERRVDDPCDILESTGKTNYNRRWDKDQTFAELLAGARAEAEEEP